MDHVSHALCIFALQLLILFIRVQKGHITNAYANIIIRVIHFIGTLCLMMGFTIVHCLSVIILLSIKLQLYLICFFNLLTMYSVILYYYMSVLLL